MENFKSIVAMSSKRFIFNYVNNNRDQTKDFHVDWMSGGGTGILLKVNRNFFILTAYHVVKDVLENPLQNSSPFWFTVQDKQ